MILKRHIAPKVEALALSRHKLAIISGPRQCGKTTLAKQLLSNPSLYYNWDQLKFRQLWTKDPDEVAKAALNDTHPRIVLDELHKSSRWKTQLKGFYDEYGDKIDIIVTGSARLNTFRKGGDSLLGRFIHFHLLPFSISELLQNQILEFEAFNLFLKRPEPNLDLKNSDAITALLKFGGFPEPLLSATESIHRIWQTNRFELLIRQDLRDLSQVSNLSQVEILASLLPIKVGSRLSIQSLREDLEVAFTTVQKWLKLLEALYYHFELKPYSKAIVRSIKKEGKIYLFDWSAIENKGSRFENMVACHLLKMCQYWSDTGAANLELFYLRNKEKKEVDFVIIKNKKPWFTVEAKNSDILLDNSYEVFQKQLKIPHFQIINRPDIFRSFKKVTGMAYVISFENFFSLTP